LVTGDKAMNEVNNRDKVFATKGHDNLRGQDKNNTSKNAILLLLLIDGILVAYLFTLLDSDQDQPVSDDDAALPDGETQPEIAALYFLDLDGRHPPLTSHDGETSTIPDLFLAEKNRLSTTDPP
jgi:hypothetical protein